MLKIQCMCILECKRSQVHRPNSACMAELQACICAKDAVLCVLCPAIVHDLMQQCLLQLACTWSAQLFGQVWVLMHNICYEMKPDLHRYKSFSTSWMILQDSTIPTRL